MRFSGELASSIYSIVSCVCDTHAYAFHPSHIDIVYPIHREVIFLTGIAYSRPSVIQTPLFSDIYKSVQISE